MSHKLLVLVLGFVLFATTFASQADAQLFRARGIFRPAGQYVWTAPKYTNYVWNEPVWIEQPVVYTRAYLPRTRIAYCDNCCCNCCDCCVMYSAPSDSIQYDSSTANISTAQPHQVMKPAIDETVQPAADRPLFEAPQAVPANSSERPEDHNDGSSDTGTSR